MKRIIINLSVFIFTFAVCLVVLEIGLRLSGYTNLQKIITSDPVLGYRLNPDTRTVIRGIEVGVSSQGLRDDVHLLPKPQGVYRILFLGDSQTWGSGVRQEEAFPKQVERALAIETINAGCPGWGPDQELLFFKNEVFRFQPDAVVLGIFVGNDYDDVLANPEDRLIVTNFSTLRKGFWDALAGKHKGFVREIKSFLRYRSSVYAFLSDKSRLVKSNTRLRDIRAGGTDSDIPFTLQIHKIIETPRVQNAHHKIEQIVLDFSNYCQEQRITPYILIIPTKNQTDETRFKNMVKSLGLNLSDFDPTLPNRALTAFCEIHNITCIDAYPMIADASKQNSGKAYHDYDDHLSLEGHRIIAEALTRLFLNKLSVDPRPSGIEL